MFNSTKTVRRLFLMAGLSAIAASASAFSIDPQIMIDLALDSPTLTVRYTGVTAALVELRVNGESLGTRSVPVGKASGETNFTLDLSGLRDGDNEIEVRLFDRTGKLVGHEHTTIKAEAAQRGPVIVSSPKMGATVQGAVEIKVSLDNTLRNAYVSFFIDGNFKSMTNFPPFNYVWDTEREPNGWHELEAWAIDDTNETHKTRKLRVFVNNPQGRTDRPGAGATLSPARNTDDYTLNTAEKPMKRVIVTGGSKPTNAAHPGGIQPKVHEALRPATNPVEGPVAVEADTKPIQIAGPIATGPHHMRPTGRRLAVGPKHTGPEIISIAPHVDRVAARLVPRAQVGNLVGTVDSAASLMTITRGSRIPDLGSFAIALDTAFVDFHGVEPRVEEGVPMTPLRYLLEQAGGKVDWEHFTKQVHAKTEGHKIDLRIGDSQARVNQAKVDLERPAYIDRGRTIVPLSLIRSTLNVQVQYDKKTGHVLITSLKK